MEMLSGYRSSSSSSEDEKNDKQRPVALHRPPPGAINLAPLPSMPLAVLRSRGIVAAPRGGGDRSLVSASGSADYHGPVQGPAALHDPADRTASFLRSVNAKTGSTSIVEADAGEDAYAFSKNRNAFQRGKFAGGIGEDDVALAPGGVAREIRRNDYGYARYHRGQIVVAADPEAAAGAGAGAGGEGGDDAALERAEAERRLVESVREKRALVVNNGGDGDMPRSRRARMKHDRTSEGPLVTSADDELSHGIWAPPSASERVLAIDSTPAIEEGIELHPRIQKERAYLAERDRQRGIMENEDNEKEKYDRMVERKMSHLLPPRLAEDAVAMEPRTIFHGDEDVDYLRLFPRTGHLLLSAGLDGACKVWSVEGRRCMRTYVGHSAAVRDVQFNNDGSKFVSASFDRFLRLWDVETGEVLGTYTNRRVPYVVKFYPKDDNIFVVGCSDNKIVAYDSTTGEITQEYDHHLAPVNTITFVEDNGMKVSI